MRYDFIHSHLLLWRIQVMCKALDVSKSGYFAWRNRKTSQRHRRDQELTDSIGAIHIRNRSVYGSPRVHRELKDQGVDISRKRVARLMRHAGLSGKPTRRFVVTTDSNHDLPIATNVLRQDFSASAPNQKWVTDITYIETGEGWLYLAAIMDLYSRRIVGWAMDATMATPLVVSALDMAVGNRSATEGLVHHSDRGSQYAGEEYRQALAAEGMVRSMSRRACCYDNAAMESFWSTLKRELVYRTKFATRSEARASIFEYIEVFYNRVRRHSTIGYLSPDEFEKMQSIA